MLWGLGDRRGKVRLTAQPHRQWAQHLAPVPMELPGALPRTLATSPHEAVILTSPKGTPEGAQAGAASQAGKAQAAAACRGHPLTITEVPSRAGEDHKEGQGQSHIQQ